MYFSIFMCVYVVCMLSPFACIYAYRFLCTYVMCVCVHIYRYGRYIYILTSDTSFNGAASLSQIQRSSRWLVLLDSLLCALLPRLELQETYNAHSASTKVLGIQTPAPKLLQQKFQPLTHHPVLPPINSITYHN